MHSDFPTERWFWFDPPFHRHQSALLHRQADNVWRIDFQLGPDADPEEERSPRRSCRALRAMLGDKVVRHRVGQRVYLSMPAHALVSTRPRLVRG
jgi:3-(3-hydroxy-phenyl)propionate hydroxylase